MARMFIGSIADRLVHTASRSVLVVRQTNLGLLERAVARDASRVLPASSPPSRLGMRAMAELLFDELKRYEKPFDTAAVEAAVPGAT